ncbi:TRAP transporter small permease [Labrenzia sp. PHM005]|uniref:TRAP transporter small permease n=1 Tax=Labrenzia sp. PHM005 TaxID=2590016 RepID=UPI0011402063|nr:TRAP transporter small permease [Labrenzia sp. PHM005]QDG75400.1 TRAP transporter small permease [Labrenzia sp. PHM005]
MTVLRWMDANAERYLAAALLAFIVLLISFNVVMRYVFNASLSWGEELTLWTFVWFIWIAVSYGFHKREHIRITVLKDQLPDRVQLMLDMLVDVLILMFLTLLTYECLKLIQLPYVAKQKSVVLGLPIPILYASAPVGAALSSIRVVQHLLSTVSEFRGSSSGQVS